MNALDALTLMAACCVVLVGGVLYYVRRWIDAGRRLPPSGSSAREPMRRLAEAEATLEELLGQLDDNRLPARWVSRTRQTVANTSHALRALAARLETGERALRRSEWRWEQETLTETMDELRDRLARGLDAYDRLIAALGHAVASTTAPPLDALTEAIEHLSGLAQALRELRDHDR